MNQIGFKSIIIKLFKNRKIGLALILIPLILGILMGGLKAIGAKTEITDAKKEILASKMLQYNSLKDSNEKLADYVKNSIYLNLIDKNVEIKEYKVYVNDNNSDGVQTGQTGFYYAASIPSEEELNEIKKITGLDSEDRYLSELIPVTYLKDTNILTVSGVFSDKATAEKLADLNLKRIQNLYSASGEDHKLEIVGSRFKSGPDQDMIDSLNTVNAKIDEQEIAMNKLKPGVVQYDENSPKTSVTDILKSVIKWGVLGLSGGIALALIYGLLSASSSNAQTVKDITEKSGVEYLGFAGVKKPDFTERLQIGKIEGFESELERIISKVAVLVKKNNSENLYLIGRNKNGNVKLLERIRESFTGINVKEVDSINRDSILDMKENDIVLFLEQLDNMNSDYLKSEMKTIQEMGMNVAGFVVSN